LKGWAAHGEVRCLFDQAKALAILNTPGLDVADSDLALQAIGWYAEKNVDFIAAYNAAWIASRAVHNPFGV